MLCLESLRCHCCKERELNIYNVRICKFCGCLRCRMCPATKCQRSTGLCCELRINEPKLDYILQFAVEPEVKRLNFTNWNPFSCNWCNQSITALRPAGYLSPCKLACRECALYRKISLQQRTIDTFMRISNELQDYFEAGSSNAQLGNKLVLKSLKCAMCKRQSRVEYFTAKGNLSCAACLTQIKKPCQVVPRNSCLRIFSWLIDNIDSDELKSLTYSKWTPLRCEDCSTPYSDDPDQIPIHLPTCGRLNCANCARKHECENCSGRNETTTALNFLTNVISEFRSLYKNGGSDLEENVGTASSDGNSHPQTSGAGEKNHEETASNLVRCQDCEQLKEPQDVRVCLTCEKNSICTVCAAKDHECHMVVKNIDRRLMQSCYHDNWLSAKFCRIWLWLRLGVW